MKLTNELKRSITEFSYYYANGTLGLVIDDKEILKNINYREELKEEASLVEMVYAIYINNLVLDNEGKLLNKSHALKRASQYIRSVCDSEYDVFPDFEDWETEI